LLCDSAAAGPESDAYADLTSALGDIGCDNTIESRNGENERHDRQDIEEPGTEPRARQLGGNQVADVGGTHDGYVAVNAPNRFAHNRQ